MRTVYFLTLLAAISLSGFSAQAEPETKKPATAKETPAATLTAEDAKRIKAAQKKDTAMEAQQEKKLLQERSKRLKEYKAEVKKRSEMRRANNKQLIAEKQKEKAEMQMMLPDATARQSPPAQRGTKQPATNKR